MITLILAKPMIMFMFTETMIFLHLLIDLIDPLKQASTIGLPFDTPLHSCVLILLVTPESNHLRSPRSKTIILIIKTSRRHSYRNSSSSPQNLSRRNFQ